MCENRGVPTHFILLTIADMDVKRYLCDEKFDINNHRHMKRKWNQIAWYYVTHPSALNDLLSEVRSFASRDGLRKVKDDVADMYGYVRDVAGGRYKDYNLTSLLLAVASMVYLVTPADMIPDFMPAGLVDDVSVLAWAAKQVVDELDKYKKSLLEANEGGEE